VPRARALRLAVLAAPRGTRGDDEAFADRTAALQPDHGAWRRVGRGKSEARAEPRVIGIRPELVIARGVARRERGVGGRGAVGARVNGGRLGVS
jgi:hypothetical protein